MKAKESQDWRLRIERLIRRIKPEQRRLVFAMFESLFRFIEQNQVRPAKGKAKRKARACAKSKM